MNSHELARRLLELPPQEVFAQAGEDSRDNPCYHAVKGVSLYSTENTDLADVMEGENIIVLHTGEL